MASSTMSLNARFNFDFAYSACCGVKLRNSAAMYSPRAPNLSFGFASLIDLNAFTAISFNCIDSFDFEVMVALLETFDACDVEAFDGCDVETFDDRDNGREDDRCRLLAWDNASCESLLQSKSFNAEFSSIVDAYVNRKCV